MWVPIFTRPKVQTPSPPLSLHSKYRGFHPRFDAFLRQPDILDVCTLLIYTAMSHSSSKKVLTGLRIHAIHKAKFHWNLLIIICTVSKSEVWFFSPPVRMHGGLLCITFCLSVGCDVTKIQPGPKVTWQKCLLAIWNIAICLPMVFIKFTSIKQNVIDGLIQKQVGSFQRQVAFF